MMGQMRVKVCFGVSVWCAQILVGLRLLTFGRHETRPSDGDLSRIQFLRESINTFYHLNTLSPNDQFVPVIYLRYIMSEQYNHQSI